MCRVHSMGLWESEFNNVRSWPESTRFPQPAPWTPTTILANGNIFAASSTPASNDSSTYPNGRARLNVFANSASFAMCRCFALRRLRYTTNLRCWMGGTAVHSRCTPGNARRSRSMESANCVGRWCKSPCSLGDATNRLREGCRLASESMPSYAVLRWEEHRTAERWCRTGFPPRPFEVEAT